MTLGGPGSTTDQDLIASLGTFTTGTDFALHDFVPLTVTGAVSITTGYVAIQTTGTNTGITIASGGSLVGGGQRNAGRPAESRARSRKRAPARSRPTSS